MATARKPYIRIETSLLREPWEMQEKAALVMLACFLGDRWARDRLTAEQACRATLSPAQLFEITGKRQLTSARRVLHSLATRVSLLIELQGNFTSIYWPKFAETQELPSRGRELKTRAKPISAPAPSPAPSPAEEKESQPLRDATRDLAEPVKKAPPEARQAANNLALQIPVSTPGADVPMDGSARFDRWAQEIDRLKRLDNGGAWTWEEIDSVVDWLPTHDGGEFAWGRVVRSAKKLRQHFPMLMAAMQNEGRKPQKVETEDQRNLRELREWRQQA